jgi:hypothetical protein
MTKRSWEAFFSFYGWCVPGIEREAQNVSEKEQKVWN